MSVEQDIKAIRNRLDELDGIMGDQSKTLADFHTLLSNHMSDYATKFGRLKASIEAAVENSKERDKALHTKIDAYKWGLVLTATFAVVSLVGFVTLAVYMVVSLM